METVKSRMLLARVYLNCKWASLFLHHFTLLIFACMRCSGGHVLFGIVCAKISLDFVHSIPLAEKPPVFAKDGNSFDRFGYIDALSSNEDCNESGNERDGRVDPPEAWSLFDDDCVDKEGAGENSSYERADSIFVERC